MYSAACRRCLTRPSVDQISWLLSTTHVTVDKQAVAAFSTSTAQNAPPKKKLSSDKMPKRGTKQGGVKKKSKSNTRSGDSPKPGERKAFRQRIVLSNTSALDVPLEELSKENIRNDKNVGSVFALPNELIDRLRFSNAFRRTQGWQYFRRPAILVRKETAALAQAMNNIGNKHISRVLTGDKGSGKSLLLLQAQAIAFQNGWTVINFPEARTIADGSSDYRPVPQSRPPVYDQREYVSQLMRRIAASNPQLRDQKLALQHEASLAVKKDGSVLELVELGGRDYDNVIPLFHAMMKELTAPGRPQILISMDNFTHVMTETAYRNPQFKKIHAHDLTIVRWFMSHLSGEQQLPNGGIVLAATSASARVKVDALEFRLHQLEVKQAIEQGLPDPRHDAELPHPMLPFLLATGQQPNPVPQPDAHRVYDQRVFEVLGSPYGVVAGNKTASEREVQVQRVSGMSKDEARGIMEYWAKSGMMRRTIDERTVAEKWSLSGGGVPGELERACVKYRL